MNVDDALDIYEAANKDERDLAIQYLEELWEDVEPPQEKENTPQDIPNVGGTYQPYHKAYVDLHEKLSNFFQKSLYFTLSVVQLLITHIQYKNNKLFFYIKILKFPFIFLV